MVSKPVTNIKFPQSAIVKIESKPISDPSQPETLQVTVDGKLVTAGLPPEAASSALIITGLTYGALQILTLRVNGTVTIAIEKPERRGSDTFFTAVYGDSVTLQPPASGPVPI